jgi:hypothetical protein
LLAPWFWKFGSKGAATHHELRKPGTTPSPQREYFQKALAADYYTGNDPPEFFPRASLWRFEWEFRAGHLSD